MMNQCQKGWPTRRQGSIIDTTDYEGKERAEEESVAVEKKNLKWKETKKKKTQTRHTFSSFTCDDVRARHGFFIFFENVISLWNVKQTNHEYIARVITMSRFEGFALTYELCM